MNIKQLTDHRINMMKLIEEFTKEGLYDIVVNIAETMKKEVQYGYDSIRELGFERGATRLYSLKLLVYVGHEPPSVFDLISAIDRHEHKDLILDGLYEHMGKPGVYECVKDYLSTGGFLFRLEKCATEAHEQFEKIDGSVTVEIKQEQDNG